METNISNDGSIIPSSSNSSGQKALEKPGNEKKSEGFLKQMRDSAIGKVVEKIVEEIWPKIQPHFKKVLIFFEAIGSIILSYVTKLTPLNLFLISVIFILLTVCLILIYMLILHLRNEK